MVRVLCPNCSNAFTPAPGAATTCPRCGYTSGAPISGPSSPAMSPVGSRSGAPSYSYAAPLAPAPAAPPQNVGSNGLSIASGVLGMVGIPLFVLVVPAILAVIFGIIGLNQVKKTGQKGKGMAITGIVLGSVVVLGYAVFLFVVFTFAEDF